MAKSDIYSKVLAYMCENYNYDLYATNLNTKAISHIQHTFASVPVSASENRIEATKIALQDFLMQFFKKFLSTKMRRD